LEPFRKEVSERVIPTSEIAKLAAILAHGRDITNPQNLAFIATQAIALWEECEKARKRRIDMLAMYARAKVLDDALPKPKSDLTSLDEFLRAIMPDKRVEDRMKFYREYIRQSIRIANHLKKPDAPQISIESTPFPSDEEVAKCIAHDKERGFHRHVFSNFASNFLRWFDKNKDVAKRQRGQAGAEARKMKLAKNG